MSEDPLLPDAGPGRPSSVSWPGRQRLQPGRLRSLPSGWGRPGWELLAVTPLYVLLSLVFTFPLVLNFGQYALGDLESDMWKHLWGMWWTKVNLLDQNTLPLHTHLLNYPYGGALFFIDPLNGVLSTPLHLFWGPATVYNLMALFNVVLGAVGAFCLARSLSGNGIASFFGGAVYGFSAYMMAYLTSGVSEAFNIGWIPLFFLFFIRMLRTNLWADAVRAGVFFALATVGCWYYGAFCVLFGVLYYLYAAWRRYRKVLGRALAGLAGALRPPWSRRVFGGLGTAALAAFVLARLPRLLDPFQGSGLDFVLVLVAFLGVVSLVLRMGDRPTSRSARAWTALLALAPGLGALVFEAWVGMATLLGLPHEARPQPFLEHPSALGVQALVVVPLAVALLLARRQQVRTLVRLLTPHGPFLVSLGLLAGGALAVLAVPGLQAGGPGGTVAAVAVMLLAAFFSWRQALRPYEGEEGDLLAEYRRFLAPRAAGLLVVALASLPALRVVLPEVPALPLLATWLSGQALLHLVLAGLAGMGRARPETRAAVLAGARGFWDRMLSRPLVMALVGAVLVVGPATAFKRTLNAGDSMVYRKREAARVELYLSRRFMNVSRLVDYVRPGKAQATRSYTVDKLTRTSYAGWVTLGVVGVGLLAGVRRRQFRFWLAMAGLFAMFSLGPFLYITDDLFSQRRSPLYMAFFNWFPLFSQVSIPQRFTALVMLSLGVLSALTLSTLCRRWARRDQALLVAGLTLAMLFDVALFSPAPFPIPLSGAQVPEYCRSLAEDPQESGLLDLPFQRYKGELLPGEYFYYQTIHRKMLPNRVEGTIPVYVYQNPFTNYLFVLEHSQQDMPPRDRATLEQGLVDLSKFKFRYIVVHDKLLRTAARERLHGLLSFYLGPPEVWPDRVCVYRVPRGLHLDAAGVLASREEPSRPRRKEGNRP